MPSKCTLHGELMFPSEFLAAVEFKGRDVTLTITDVSKEELQLRTGSKKKRPVLRFAKTEKKLVLNITNTDSIVALHGAKAELWIGKSITLYPTTCSFGRETVDCIRIREKAPAVKPASLAGAREVAEPEISEDDPRLIEADESAATDWAKK